jgi:tyrosine-protein kinase Etk/Wzc
MIQVEDGKGAGAAALLGDLGSAMPGGLGGKSAADAEIEILNSRKVLGQTIQDLKLDIRITDEQSSLTYRLLNPVQSKVIYKNNVVTW